MTGDPVPSALGTRLAAHARSLACPTCRMPILQPGGLRCHSCGKTFEVRDGIPFLIAGETPPPVDLEEHARTKERFNRSRWRRRLLYPPLVSTRFQEEAVRRFLDSFPPGALIVDVGSSLVDVDPRVLRLDLVYSRNLDLVGDAQAIPFVDDSVDGIVCTGLLEHVERPERVVAEIRRVLRPGGRVYAAAPFIQGYHPSPTDFRRFTREGMAQLFECFRIESLRNTRGSGSSVAWILSAFLTELLSFDRPWLYRLVGVPVRWACLPLKYLDRFLVGNRFDHFITSGFTVEARKPDA